MKPAASTYAAGLNGNGPAGIAPFPLTDLGNAERLIAAHGRDLLYVPGLGWHVYAAGRWERDDTGEVQRRAKLTARAILHDAASCDDDDERKRTVKWAALSESEPRLRAAIKLAESDATIVARPPERPRPRPRPVPAERPERHDRPPHRGAARPRARRPDHDDDRRHVRPAGRCPRWERFLAEIFAGDLELVEYVQRFVGYCLTGDTREQTLAVLHGFGCNGKSTLLTVLKRLLGDYAMTAPFDTFMRARSDHGPGNELARLRGSRLVTASESGEGKRLDEATVKEITGGDTIAARFLYGEHFEYTPQFKLILVTNHRPKVDGADDAIWRRIRLVPFEENFEGREDKTLTATLHHELPCILVFGRTTTVPFTSSTVGERARKAWGWKPVPNPALKDDPKATPREVWVKTREDALEPIGLYEARHSAASYLIEAGLNDIELTAMVGHSDSRTTENIYGHLFPDSHEKVAAKLDAYLEPGTIADSR